MLVVTGGMLTAYLDEDPLLGDVATVVLDEFHERSLHTDVGLALVRQAWLARSDRGAAYWSGWTRNLSMQPAEQK